MGLRLLPGLELQYRQVALQLVLGHPRPVLVPLKLLVPHQVIEDRHAQRFLQQVARKSGVAAPDAQNADAEGDIICDACTTIDARCVKHCLVCVVRCCAMERGVKTCAHCQLFPCDRLQSIWKITVFKDAQPRLEKLHQELTARPG